MARDALPRWFVVRAALLVSAVGCSSIEDASVDVQHGAASGPISFVQGSSAVPQTAQTLVSVPFGSAQGAGHLNVVAVGWNDTTAQVTSVTDTLGNVYQLAVGPTARAGAVSQSLYYAKNIAGGAANAVFVAFSPPAAFPDVRIAEYKNVDTLNPLDVTAASSGTNASSTSGAVLTTNANDLLVGANLVATGTTRAGSGFTSRMITSPDGDILEDRVVTATASLSATAPLSSAGPWVMQMAAFRAPDITLPTAPANLTATAASTNQITLSWSASTDNIGVTGYLVERCQGAGCTVFAQVGSSAAATFASTGLAGATSYSYRVRATDAAGNLSGTSNVASATTLGDLGASCTAAGQCGSGFCVSGVCCDTACAGNACMACDVAGSVGHCSPRPDGTACDDGDACTQVDVCQAGACAGGSPVVCGAADACHLPGTCDPATGACSNPVNPGEPTACGGQCVDTTTDAANCGGCGVACAAGQLCTAGVCTTPAPSVWPTLGGNTMHTGFNATETGHPPLALAWQKPLDASWPLWPAVSDGSAVYVTARSYEETSTLLWALSPDDGHLLWSHDFGHLFEVGQATVDSGHVYVAQCNNFLGTYMYSFNASTGDMLWSQPFDAQWEYYWAPLVVGGQIYFDGGTYGGLYGLSTTDGSQLFFNNQLEQTDSWSPLPLGGNIYTFTRGNLRAHDPQTGSTLSTSTVPFNFFMYDELTSPVSDGTKIYVVSPPSLYAFQPGNALPDWTATASYVFMPALAGGVLYTVSGSQFSGGQLSANDAATGAVLWTFAGDSAINHPPVVAGHWVYAASDTHVYAIDTTAPQQAAWSGAPGGWLSIAGGKLYVAQTNGTLSAYALTH